MATNPRHSGCRLVSGRERTTGEIRNPAHYKKNGAISLVLPGSSARLVNLHAYIPAMHALPRARVSTWKALYSKFVNCERVAKPTGLWKEEGKRTLLEDRNRGGVDDDVYEPGCSFGGCMGRGAH